MNDSHEPDLSENQTNEEESITLKIHELENQLKTLRSDLDLKSGIERYLGKQRWVVLFYVALLLILSIIPPFLIFLDRWLKVDSISNYQRDTLCKVDFLCRIGEPGYFVWVIFCMIMVIILMTVLAKHFQGTINFIDPKKETHETHENLDLSDQLEYRKQLFIVSLSAFILEIVGAFLFNRVPGAELILIILIFLIALKQGEQKINFRFQNWREKVNLYATVIFSQVALILFLREIITIHMVEWIYIVLLILAIIPVIRQWKKLGKIYWLFTLGVILFTYQMNSWKFSKIGDEYGAFYYAYSVVAHSSIFQIMDSFFSEKALYETISYLSSFLQNLSMEFLGYDFFGWHLSNILLVLFSIPLFYNFLKSFVSERVAFITVFLITVSHYLINFAHVGNPNLNSFFAFGLVLWTSGWALKRRTLSAYFLLGISIASCPYFFPAALYLMPLPIFLIVLFDPPISWQVWKRYLLILAGILVLATPLFFQPFYWGVMLSGTAYASFTNLNDLFFKFGSNFFYAFFDYLYLINESHFVTVSHVDPLTAVFVLPGLILACLNLRRNRFMIFMVVSYIFEIFMLSLTVYGTPPNSRMYLLLPFLLFWAAIGIDWVAKLLAGITYRPGNSYRVIVSAILVMTCGLNIVQATIIYPNRVEGYDIDVAILRMLQHDEHTVVDNPANSKNYLFIVEGGRDLTWLDMFQDVYHLPQSKSQLMDLAVDGSALPQYWLDRFKKEENLVVVSYYLEPNLQQFIDPIMAQSDKVACDFADKPNHPNSFRLWVSPKFQNICGEVQSME